MRRLLATITALLLTLAGAAALSTAPISPAYAADRDCGDFSSQAAAQSFFLDNGGPNYDPPPPRRRWRRDRV